MCMKTTRFTVQLSAMIALLAACGDPRTAGAARQDAGEVDLSARTQSRMASDPLAQRADSLLRAGRPWRATVQNHLPLW